MTAQGEGDGTLRLLPVANAVVYLEDANGDPYVSTDDITLNWQTDDGLPSTGTDRS